MISTITQSQRNLGEQENKETKKQTDIQYTVTAGPEDQRSENLNSNPKTNIKKQISIKKSNKHKLSYKLVPV